MVPVRSRDGELSDEEDMGVIDMIKGSFVAEINKRLCPW